MTTILVIALVLMTGAYFRAEAKARVDRTEAFHNERANHAKCIAHIAAVTSNRMAADALLRAAERYDSVDGADELTNVIRTRHTVDGPSVPALWMQHQAERILAGGPLLIDNESEKA